ncbi:DUF771 domain-containing protein [Staphylococcus simiae]|uniref:DUF771 domain-containing protein n=1 Tax=Staphylococcus simiae CCM 7213 = CCUG 51256 TaxID=911238 RepID=G5JJV4_9STAP|nr:DUF771 domain-containing protein [Staphylococcus simiae]EHJ07509.1 hypothetical protein SS7213T_08817 [Staphylococcus simiae CCM 7213 = CCUG 51256]PNZ09840.1 DUF771 domain-containing protein [Staphylococcus simiae]SNV75485.1 Uncharacterized protein conserved in bacteria [Staphylococcus simiae]
MNTKTWWTMKDLEAETSKSRNWLKANILEVPVFKKEIETFVHYPINNNDEYRFIRSKMKQFLEDKFHMIFG